MSTCRCKLSKDEAAERLERAQKRLLALRLQCGGLIGDGTIGPPLLILFEGWDAVRQGRGDPASHSAAGPAPFHGL